MSDRCETSSSGYVRGHFRQFVARASALGLSMGPIGSLLASSGFDDEATPQTEASPAWEPSGTADEIAVEAAQEFSGGTLNVNWEAGLQATDPKVVWGREFEELTGIKINVVELDLGDRFTKAIAEHIAGAGAFDILNIQPAWVPDVVVGGALEPLDDLVAEYYPTADLDDYHPLYKQIATWQGTRYGSSTTATC